MSARFCTLVSQPGARVQRFLQGVVVIHKWAETPYACKRGGTNRRRKVASDMQCVAEKAVPAVLPQRSEAQHP